MPDPVAALGVPAVPRKTSLPRWPVATAFIGALLMGSGGIIALVRPELLVSGGSEINQAARIFAGYLISRNLAIAAVLLTSFGLRARSALGSFMVLAGLIQLFDGVVDAFEGRWPLVPVVLILGVGFLVAAARLLPKPFWKTSSW